MVINYQQLEKKRISIKIKFDLLHQKKNHLLSLKLSLNSIKFVFWQLAYTLNRQLKKINTKTTATTMRKNTLKN